MVVDAAAASERQIRYAARGALRGHDGSFNQFPRTDAHGSASITISHGIRCGGIVRRCGRSFLAAHTGIDRGAGAEWYEE
jgi:hypothetical protein